MHASKAPKSKGLFIAILCILIALAISIWFYDAIPQTMITHWGINGEANGFMPKEIGLSIIPAIMAILVAVLYLVPKLDPLKKNIEEFQNEYQNFIAVFLGFMLYIQVITIAINLGLETNLLQLLAPAFAVLFFTLGKLMSKAKRNYFIGIRTPWTLASEKVWNKTHALGGKLFKGIGILALLGLILPTQAMILILAPVILGAIYLCAYSYFEYKKEKHP